MSQTKLPRPQTPESKEAGPIIKLLGGSQAKNKGFSIQQKINKKDKKRYQMLQKKK